MMTTDLMPFIEIISNTGFPIVISLYLLNRMEKKLDALVSAIENLNKNLKL